MIHSSCPPILRLAAATLLAVSASASATVSISGQAGSLRDQAGAVIANTPTLWVIIYDQNGDNQLPGGLGIDQSLDSADVDAAWSAFAGKSLAVGTIIAGDRVIAVSGFNQDKGVANFSFPALDLAAQGLVSGRIYGLYWFPGRNPSATQLPATGSIGIGGICEVTNYSGSGSGSGFLGMSIPPDQSTVSTGIYGQDLVPGALPTTRFHAITAEPRFAGWIARFPDVGDLDGFTDDPDGDGLENGVEAALGTRPDTADSGITVLSTGNPLTLRSSRAKPALADVTATWQWSADLTNWFASASSNGTATVTITESISDPGNPGFDVTTVAAAVGPGQLNRLFLRLTATLDP